MRDSLSFDAVLYGSFTAATRRNFPIGGCCSSAGIYTAKTMYERREILFAVQPTLEHYKEERDLFRGKGNADGV